jgi:hypothetical protein
MDENQIDQINQNQAWDFDGREDGPQWQIGLTLGSQGIVQKIVDGTPAQRAKLVFESRVKRFFVLSVNIISKTIFAARSLDRQDHSRRWPDQYFGKDCIKGNRQKRSRKHPWKEHSRKKRNKVLARLSCAVLMLFFVILATLQRI